MTLTPTSLIYQDSHVLSKKILRELRRRIKRGDKQLSETQRLTHFLMDSKSSGFKTQ